MRFRCWLPLVYQQQHLCHGDPSPSFIGGKLASRRRWYCWYCWYCWQLLAKVDDIPFLRSIVFSVNSHILEILYEILICVHGFWSSLNFRNNFQNSCGGICHRGKRVEPGGGSHGVFWWCGWVAQLIIRNSCTISAHKNGDFTEIHQKSLEKTDDFPVYSKS